MKNQTHSRHPRRGPGRATPDRGGFSWRRRLAAFGNRNRFLSFDAGAADTVEVSNEDGIVRLAREGEQWTLEGGLPADESKVTEMLGQARGRGRRLARGHERLHRGNASR